MSYLSEDEIISLVKNVRTNSNYNTFENIPIEIKKEIESYQKNRTMQIDLDGHEAEITGRNLVDWINPLHIERNLSNAIDALEDVERLHKEERDIIVMKTQLHLTRRLIDKSGAGSNEEVTKHDALANDLKLEGLALNISVRKTKRLLDLYEYSKAVKLGAKVLHGVEINDIDEPGQQIQGVTKIRTSLRAVIEAYRKISMNENEMVIPISLKHSKNDAENWLVPWNEPRHDQSSLAQESIEFDLSLFPKIQELQYQRILRVGFQVLDKTSYRTIAGGPGNTVGISQFPNFWDITFSDKSDGYKLGASASASKHVIKPLKLYDVLGGNSPSSNIIWATNSSIINVNANRRWELKIKKSHVNTPISDIYDIIVYFHIASNS